MKAKTRTELISAAALKFGGDAPIARRYFIAGAEWADKNPANIGKLADAIAEVESLKSQLSVVSAEKEGLVSSIAKLEAEKANLEAELAAEKAMAPLAVNKVPARRGRKKAVGTEPAEADGVPQSE